MRAGTTRESEKFTVVATGCVLACTNPMKVRRMFDVERKLRVVRRHVPVSEGGSGIVLVAGRVAACSSRMHVLPIRIPGYRSGALVGMALRQGAPRRRLDDDD